MEGVDEERQREGGEIVSRVVGVFTERDKGVLIEKGLIERERIGGEREDGYRIVRERKSNGRWKGKNKGVMERRERGEEENGVND